MYAHAMHYVCSARFRLLSPSMPWVALSIFAIGTVASYDLLLTCCDIIALSGTGVRRVRAVPVRDPQDAAQGKRVGERTAPDRR
jgi:hypothetical protein